VLFLLENGASINAVTEIKSTALHLAAQEGYPEVAKVLIENGASVNDVDEYDCTPLVGLTESEEIDEGHIKVARLLIRKSAKMNEYKSP